MIKIELDINMPKSCSVCPLVDEEFDYCHGHIKDVRAWELADNYIQGKNRPDWCPLIEVKNE